MGNIYFLYWRCRLSRHFLDWPLPFVFRQFGTSPKWPWDSSALIKNWCRSVRTLWHQLFGAEVSWCQTVLVPKCPDTIVSSSRCSPKCNEWMNEWFNEKVKTKTHWLKPMFLLSLFTNKNSYNTQIIQCVNDTIFIKRFPRYPVLEPVLEL